MRTKASVRLFVMAGVVAMAPRVQAQDATYATDAHVYLVWTQTGVTNTWQAPRDMPADLLIVGGGGSGGNGLGGGGGAGGVIFQPVTLLGGSSYSIAVGRGGEASTAYRTAGFDGESTFFDTLVAYGGGGGGAWNDRTGRDGGSGGGSANTTRSEGVAGQGCAGGIFNGNYRTGGGGGYSQQGQDGVAISPVKGGDGGDGVDLTDWLEGVALGDGGWFAGGGGGTDYQSDRIGYGGRGGGGDGGRYTANVGAGVNGTGGGGGASGDNNQVSGKGGDGIVILRYGRIVNLPVDVLTDTIAELRGCLQSTDTLPTTVFMVWGTDNRGTNMADWAVHGTVVDVGEQAEGSVWTNALGALTPNTIYWFNHVASNDNWVAWGAKDAAWFKTLGPPAVDNADGATLVSATIATLNGTVLDGAPADVSIDLWADGASETNRYDLGSRELGPFAVAALGLTPDTQYHYRGFVSNAYGTAWAETPTTFTTLATVFTGGNVTWTGAGALPYWDLATNWEGNAAPTHPTAGIIQFRVPGQDVVGILDQDRTVGGISTSAGTHVSPRPTHLLDLNGYTLTVEGTLGFSACCHNYAFSVSNGTLRIGAPGKPGRILIGGTHQSQSLTLVPGTRLISANLSSIESVSAGNGTDFIDMRGVIWDEDVLRTGEINIQGGIYETRVRLDASVAHNTIEVTDRFRMGGQCYFGDPTDNKLPAGISLKVGVNETQRGQLILSDNQNTASLVARSGGTCTAYLTLLRIGEVNGAASLGVLDLAAMDTCFIDTQELRMGVDRAVPGANDNQRGTLRLPSGTLTVGNATLGSATLGRAILDLHGVDFTVTNSIVVNPTAWVTNRVGATPRGVDVGGSLIDNGGHIHISFTEAPTEDVHWGVRIAGNAVAVLGGMVGSGRLTWDYDDEAIPGKKVGIVTDASHTYLALVDDDVPLSPIASARDLLVFEMEPDGTVTVCISEIDVGSYDPEDRPFTLTISEGGRESETALDFIAFTDHTVTLTISVDGISDSDICTVRIEPIPDAVTGNVRWSGGASTALMDRREWMWGANWMNGAPPANPTAATVEFFTLGQHAMSKLDQDRTVGNLSTLAGTHQSPTPTHILDLNSHTLTVEGFVGGNNCCFNFNFTLTNGTLRVGSPGKPGRLLFGGNHRDQTLRLAPGTRLESANISEIRSNSSSAHQDYLYMQGAVWADDILRVGEINITAGSPTGIVLDESVAGNTIEVLTRLLLGGGTTFIGDSSARNLPWGLNLAFGQGAGQRSEVLINPGGRLVAVGDGVVSGWVSSLNVGVGSSGVGRLELEAMSTVSLDAETVQVGTQNNASGILSLPPGDGAFGTIEVGSSTTGAGVLLVNRARVAVASALTVHATGIVTNTVGAVSGGIHVLNAETAGLALDPAARLVMRFVEPPESLPHSGLRWTGDHAQRLEDWRIEGRLVIDSAGLGGKEAGVFTAGGFTHVGLPSLRGSLFLLR